MEPIGDGHYLGWRHEQEDGFRGDEAPNQPGASDANDLGPRARHPHRATRRVTRRQLLRAKEQLAVLAPSFVAALQRLRVNPLASHPGGNALAELQSVLA